MFLVALAQEELIQVEITWLAAHRLVCIDLLASNLDGFALSGTKWRYHLKVSL